MKKIAGSILFLFIALQVFSQNGTITERKVFRWQDDPYISDKISEKGKLKADFQYLKDVIIEEITYESEGLKVKGYIAIPVKEGKYPCIIYNRGGNREFGKLTPAKAVFILAKTASWGYVVAAGQYRGNAGGEGKEEFGGNDVNDVLNLIPLFNNLSYADTSKIGMYGWSRGGMITYLSLTKTNRIKAAVVGGGLSDLRMMMKTRTDTFEVVYEENIPNYSKNKEKYLNERSAIHQTENICKTCPILMLHGTADWRVVPEMALELSKAFIKLNIPHRLVMFEGGDHGLNEFDEEVDDMVKKWFDDYLKNNKELPKLSPHGR